MKAKKKPLPVCRNRQGAKVIDLEDKSNPSTRNSQDSSTEAQEVRLLKSLCSGPVSTFFARKHLDIAHPAGRFKKKGYDIETVMVDDYSQTGRVHRVALYSLKRK